MYLVKEVCFVEEGDRALDGVENFFWGKYIQDDWKDGCVVGDWELVEGRVIWSTKLDGSKIIKEQNRK